MPDILDRIAHHNGGKTHWEGCGDDHILCAAASAIERLSAENTRLRDERDHYRDKYMAATAQQEDDH